MLEECKGRVGSTAHPTQTRPLREALLPLKKKKALPPLLFAYNNRARQAIAEPYARQRTLVTEMAIAAAKAISANVENGSLRCAYNSGAITRLTIAITLMRIFIEGPDVSLKGSPTVSPTTHARCASEFLPP